MSTFAEIADAALSPAGLRDEFPIDLADPLWDLLPTAVYVCDRSGLLVRCNRRAADLWGRVPRLLDPTERFCGSYRLYRVDGGLLPHAQCPMADVLRTGTPVRDQEVVIERPDGTRVVAMVNIDPLKDQDGTIVGAVNCFQDITERKRLDAELRTSRQELEDFFENAAVAMHWVGPGGLILRANQAELDLLGYTRDQYVGRRIAEFHAEPAAIANILTRLSRGETLDKYPATLRAQDGTIKRVQISSNAQFRDGEFVHTRCITVDVTAQKNLEAALHEKERRFRDLLDALPAAVYTTDASGRITYYNQAAVDMAGRRPELGSDEWCVTWKLYWPDGTPMPHDQCPMAIALKENVAIRGVEAIAERPDGTRVPFIPYPTPLHDESGALIGAVNMLVDITGRKIAENALRESQAGLTAELDATQQLQAVSAQLIHDDDLDAVYQKLVDAAALIMRSDYASMQMLYPERGVAGELRLLASRGFDPEATRFWEWVRADSGCTCGMALRTGKRAIAANVETCEFMAGTTDRDAYLRAGMYAAQSTPLISRSGRLLGMISTHWRTPHHPTESDLRRLDVLARQAADLIERSQAVAGLRAQTNRFETLNRIAGALSSDLDLERIIQAATDSATELTGAKFGAFFYNVTDESGESFMLYTLSGAPREAFEKFGLPRNTAVFEPTFRGTGVVRSDDIRKDPRYGRNAPHQGMPSGHLPVVSYLAVPVVSRSGGVHGGLFFGHDQAGVFTNEAEEIVRGIAAHAALAIDNARLYQTEKHLAERLSRSEASLSAIFSQAAAGLAQTDLTGRFLSVNDKYCEMVGRTREELLRLRMQDITHPDDLSGNALLFQRAIEAAEPFVIEKRYVRPDGSIIWVRNAVSAINDTQRRPQSALAVSVDITERKQAEELQGLLLREMSHRVKNLFAVTGGMVSLSARSASTPGEMAAAVQARLGALTRAHELTRPGLIEPAAQVSRDTTLHALLQQIVAPYVDHDRPGHRVVVNGSDVPVGGTAVTSLALILHEFTTNAAKYGALSVPAGRVRIDTVVADGQLLLVWQELDGPSLAAEPQAEGFGTVLTRRIVVDQFRGNVSRDWQPEGLIARMSVPMERLQGTIRRSA